MSYKYNISSIINKALKNDEEDKDKTKKSLNQDENKVYTKEKNFSQNNQEENNSLKEKTLDEVLEDLKGIETNYSTNDYVDAPSNLEIDKIQVPNKTEDELVKIAKDSLDKKYNTSKASTNKNFERKINDLLLQQDDYKTSTENKKNNIDEYYNEAIKNTENQALKRGLARSSIIINQISNLNGEKANALTNTMKDLENSLINNQKEITSLNQERDLALENLDIEYLIELDQKLEEVKSDYNKSVQDAIEFNNNVEKLKAEYQLDLDKQKLDKQETITKLEDEYGVNYTTIKTNEAKFNYLKTYFDTLDKDYAINLFLTNKDLKSVLGDNYSKMYKYLKNR